MMALCTGRDLSAPRHLAWVDARHVDADPSVEIACSECGARLGPHDLGAILGVLAVDGNVMRIAHWHQDDDVNPGWVYVKAVDDGTVIWAPVNRLKLL